MINHLSAHKEQEAIISELFSGGFICSNAIFQIFQAIISIIIAIFGIIVEIINWLIGAATVVKCFLLMIKFLLVQYQKKREEEHRI
jgi:hypothetical protein